MSLILLRHIDLRVGKSFVGHRRFIYLPIEGVNVAPRVNPNYLPELLSTTSESYRQPNYSPVPHTRAYVLSALNTSTQPTAAIPYPVSYSQSDIRMHATKQHYFDSNGIDNESTRYNAFQEKVESPQSISISLWLVVRILQIPIVNHYNWFH